MKKLLLVIVLFSASLSLWGKLTIYNNIDTDKAQTLPFKVKFYDALRNEIKDAKSNVLEAIDSVFMPNNAEYISGYVCKKTWGGLGSCDEGIKTNSMSELFKLTEEQKRYTDSSIYVACNNNKLFFSDKKIESSNCNINI